jgi:hypothetical protein
VADNDRSLGRHCDEILKMIDEVLAPASGPDGGPGDDDRRGEPARVVGASRMPARPTQSRKRCLHAPRALGSWESESEEQLNQ